MENFNRQAFEAAVSQHSPLTLENFEALFGGKVDEANKAIAWQLMRYPAKLQYIVWNVRKHFDEATLNTVR
jgi:hypothetical protein